MALGRILDCCGVGTVMALITIQKCHGARKNPGLSSR